MENETPQNTEPTKVHGDLTDPYVAQRLVAVSKAKKGIKRVKALETVTEKVATAFGAVSEEVTAERKVEETPSDEKTEKIKAELDSQLINGVAPSESALTSGISSGGMTVTKVDESKLEEVKKTRDLLAGLWSVPGEAGVNPEAAEERKERRGEIENDAYAGVDKYIEVTGSGTPDKETQVNNDSGLSGVRIKFRG